MPAKPKGRAPKDTEWDSKDGGRGAVPRAGGGRARAGGALGRIAEPAEPTARTGRSRRRFPLLLAATVALLVALTAHLPNAAAEVDIAALAAGVADLALRNCCRCG